MIVRVSWVGTALFVVVAAAAAAAPGMFGTAAVAVSLVLFAAGCGAFLWAYGTAIGRSRVDQIGIGGLFFLQGTAPDPVRRHLLGALAVQVVVALAAASTRPYTRVAFVVLAPMFGLGLAGLWGARHGSFAKRAEVRAQRALQDGRASGPGSGPDVDGCGAQPHRRH